MISYAANSTNRLKWSNSLARAAAILLLTGVCSCKHEAIAYERRPQLVDVAPATSSDSARDLVLTGSVEAERSWALSFATIGTVEQVLVREGEAVKQGQVLARLSARSYQDALGIASSKARQAEEAWRRLEPMYRNKTLPEIKMVEIESGREQARLAVSMAQKSLADTVLRSPESGIIARRVAEPGMNLAPGVPAFTLVRTRNMLATASLPERQVGQVKLGDRAFVAVDALGRTFEGKVTEIGITADILTRSYPVKIEIPNTDAALRIGMLAEVRVPREDGGKAILVEPRAVHVDSAGNHHVFVLGSDSRLQLRRIKVVGFLKEGTAVGEGIVEGELVVTSDSPMLADGTTVRVRGRGIPAQDAGTGDAP